MYRVRQHVVRTKSGVYCVKNGRFDFTVVVDSKCNNFWYVAVVLTLNAILLSARPLRIHSIRKLNGSIPIYLEMQTIYKH